MSQSFPTSELTALEPLDTRPLFQGLGHELVVLLRGLEAKDWDRPTLCSRWRVRDIAAHLLDTVCRRLAFERDRMTPPPPDREIASYSDLVAFLDGLNATWVEAARRLSPRLLTDLLEVTEAWLAEHLRGLDLEGPATFPVSWAGEDSSRCWFDIARELTERWVHQQQIRHAVGAPRQLGDTWWPAVLETFLRVLPHAYREVDAAPGESASLRIVAPRRVDVFTLVREDTGWTLWRGAMDEPTARLKLDAETAWRSLTKGIPRDAALERVEIHGREDLALPFFASVAVMA